MLHRSSRILVLAICATALLVGGRAAPDDVLAVVPGQNGRILFVKEVNFEPHIMTVNADGSGLQDLGPGISPAWSPDGRLIAFFSVTEFEIAVMDADGSDVTPIPTPLSQFENDIAWSPDGITLAYHGTSIEEDPQTQFTYRALYTVLIDGTENKELIRAEPHPQSSVGAPEWSPDGTAIAFLMLHAIFDPPTDITTDVYVMSADGTGVTQLTSDRQWNERDVSWSPDGTTLVFVAPNEAQTAEIAWTMNPDGTGKTPLSPDFLGSGLAWAPDGGSFIGIAFGNSGTEIGFFNLNAELTGTVPGISNLLTSTTPPRYQPKQPGVVHSVEFTQAVQQWQTLEELKAGLENDGMPPIPMVAGKPAVMRVYLNQGDPANYDVVVTGPAGSTTFATSVNGTCTPADRRESRNSCHSINYYFTPPEGDWDVRIDVRQGGTIEEHDFALRSVHTKPLHIVLLDVCHERSLLFEWTCTDGTALLQHAAMLRDVYPGKVTFSYTPAQVRRTVPSAGTLPWWSGVVSDVNAVWVADGSDLALHYHGAVGSTPGGIAGMARLTGNAGASKLIASVLAHEMFHNFGRLHVPTLAESCIEAAGPDPGWPHATPHIDEVGFGVSIALPRRPDTLFDVMSYCRPQWISMYTYRALLDLVTVPSSAPVAPRATVSGQFWMVSGLIENGVATVDPIFQLGLTADDGAGAGSHRIEVEGAGGAALFTRFFDPGATSESEAATFFETIPVQAGVTAIVVRDDQGTEIGRVTFGAAPSVSIAGPDANGIVSWSVTDADSDDHTFSVQYSQDGGASWITAVGRTTDASFDVDSVKLPGSSTAMVRVLASDGTSTGTSTTGAFVVPGGLPEVQITSPAGQAFDAGELVWLQAAGFDKDDGVLDAAALSWTSSLDGALGTGADLPVYDLSPGTHTITVQAKDSANNVATDTTVVTVGTGEVVDGQRTWGDNDCDGAVTLADAALAAAIVAGLPTDDPCLDAGGTVTISGVSHTWSDTNCNGGPDASDVTRLLSWLVGLAVPPVAQCPAVGDEVLVGT